MYEKVFDALGNECRSRIVQMLVEKDMIAGDIANCFDISQPSVSRHLEVLRRADLVRFKKNGTKVTYSLNKSLMCEVSMYLMNVIRSRFVSEEE